MASHVDEPRSRSSDSSDEKEMQERLSLDEEKGQEDRLLSNEHEYQGKGDSKVEYKVEWRLRTGWAIAGSILAAIGVFIVLALFAKYYIVEDFKKDPAVDEVLSRDFRRPSSDYILDPSWDFNTARTVREYKWTILDRVANPDGVYRPMLTINGKFPGPMIECNEGDTLVIEVENLSINGKTQRSRLLIYRQLTDQATSIHFHGIFQNGTNWMDGATGITQCPIAPGRKFRYEFTVNGQSGTYFYHGHQAVQMADGLFGPLVIHSRNEKSYQKIPYATDRVVMLQDYYHELSHGLLKSSLEPGSESSPIPDAALINGYVLLCHLLKFTPVSHQLQRQMAKLSGHHQKFVEWLRPYHGSIN
jgi:FtsP/CotA-like multicopper oxidase with cupredoxin domain